MADPVLTGTDARGVATVTLNRPDVHNAFDDPTIAALTEAFERLGADETVRAVVLTGAGKSFSAGADLNWMRAMAAYSMEENRADADRLAAMLHALDELPRPTVARINGGAFGGAVGLIAACDIAIAADRATFGITEVRLGLIPAVISPYLLRAVGPRTARRYALTGERFDAAAALAMGLVHEAVPESALDDAVAAILDALLCGAPGAQADAKRLVREVCPADRIDAVVRADTARRIAARRATAEAREGMAAFFDRRGPGWAKD
ncbi:MAG TPA: enoyl-CoA hydratase/isomerase family protein [Alphaproteobacteria bacterium]|nr:enoyl-CoA hydratase/isomerase family protein [Alphaproteobacteria bacterium]